MTFLAYTTLHVHFLDACCITRCFLNILLKKKHFSHFIHELAQSVSSLFSTINYISYLLQIQFTLELYGSAHDAFWNTFLRKNVSRIHYTSCSLFSCMVQAQDVCWISLREKKLLAFTATFSTWCFINFSICHISYIFWYFSISSSSPPSNRWIRKSDMKISNKTWV